MANVYAKGEHLRVLDWGDTSISHPFASLGVTFRFLEERNRLLPDDPCFARLRDRRNVRARSDTRIARPARAGSGALYPLRGVDKWGNVVYRGGKW